MSSLIFSKNKKIFKTVSCCGWDWRLKGQDEWYTFGESTMPVPSLHTISFLPQFSMGLVVKACAVLRTGFSLFE